MIIQNLFYVDVEVKGAEGNSDMPKNLKGAFVNCYTFAGNENEAKAKVSDCLEEDKYEIIKINDCYQVDSEQFKDSPENNEGEPVAEDIDSLREANDVFYGEFHGYTDE